MIPVVQKRHNMLLSIISSWVCGLILGFTTMNGVYQTGQSTSKGIVTVGEEYYQKYSKDKIQMNSTDQPLLTTEPSSLPIADREGDGLLTCGEWIPAKRRKVLFVELHRWEEYYGASKYKTGEYYMSASWDFALRKLGFQVDRVSTRYYYERMTSEELHQYHRIFVRDPKHHQNYKNNSILCRVRPMYFFGGWFYGKNDYNYRFQVPFFERQIVSAHPDDHNTFLGYFPHNLLSNDDPPVSKRGKVGLLYGKKPEYFKGYTGLISALLAQGFELHTTCKDTKDNQCPFPPEVIRHRNVKPDEFAQLMKRFAFMLGFKKPEGSPSPLVGLSYGVSFLNPLRKRNGVDTQHKTLSRLGFPYTYTVDLDNVTQVVQAAEWASKYRFASYVPPQYRVESLVNRMCTVIEDDALCLCPNRSFSSETNITSNTFCD